MGYEHMSEPGRRIAEFIELSMRRDVLKARHEFVPETKISPELVKDLQNRFDAMSETEREVITDLRSPVREHFIAGHFKKGRLVFHAWLEKHLKSYPLDASHFLVLEREFGGNLSSRLRELGTEANNFKWKMQHKY